MNSTSVVVFRPRSGVRSLTAAEASDLSLRRRVGTVWGLLILNVLAFQPGLTVLPIPHMLGQFITQGALTAALLVALTANRRVILRPNVFLSLVSLLGIETIMTILGSSILPSTTYRTLRFVEFVAVLWLLTPYWGRRDLLLVRCHLKAMWVIVVSVVIGLLIAPGRARADGRLSGVLWPIVETQVAHYSAVLLGLAVVFWLCGEERGRPTLILAGLAAVVLILTHTRTALVAAIAGIVIAGLSLLVTEARVRKMFAIGGTVVAVAVLTLSGALTNWLERGQGTQELLGLTGRTAFWESVLTSPRNKFQEIFGFGLGNDNIGGLPIDSNWLASYQEEGLFGVVVCAVILIFLFAAAYFQPRGVRRALALFLITYCLVASFTEIGFTDVTPYLLDLTVAASLLVPFVADNGKHEVELA